MNPSTHPLDSSFRWLKVPLARKNLLDTSRDNPPPTAHSPWAMQLLKRFCIWVAHGLFYNEDCLFILFTFGYIQCTVFLYRVFYCVRVAILYVVFRRCTVSLQCFAEWPKKNSHFMQLYWMNKVSRFYFGKRKVNNCGVPADIGPFQSHEDARGHAAQALGFSRSQSRDICF